MMKLNKKGWSKAERYLCPECWGASDWERPKEPEFEPEDFKPEAQIKPKEPDIRLSVEEVVEYNPKKWNQWPQVRPIKKGNYRVEHDENGYTYKFGFYWNGHFWEGRKGYGPLCSNTFQDGFRFKPWYDEWEDKE